MIIHNRIKYRTVFDLETEEFAKQYFKRYDNARQAVLLGLLSSSWFVNKEALEDSKRNAEYGLIANRLTNWYNYPSWLDHATLDNLVRALPEKDKHDFCKQLEAVIAH